THLNISGLVALLPLAWDVAATKDTSPRRRWGRWLAWAAMVFLLAVLFWLHPHLDAFLDLEARHVINRKPFRSAHRPYLWLSTLQWGCGVVYILLMLSAWRAQDRCRTRPADGSGSAEPDEMGA